MAHSPSKLTAATVASLLLLTCCTAPASGPQPSRSPSSSSSGGSSSEATSATSTPATPTPVALTEPRFPLASAIREHFTIATGTDADRDGKPDVIAFDVIRPDTTEKVPVIAMESPYFGGAGRGATGEDKVIDKAGIVQSMPLFYDNYFVPRGYAVVAIDAPGTGRSTGCGTLFGSPAQRSSTRLVLSFLAGKGKAQDSTGATRVANWSTGAVGMIGKSADGSYPIGAAAAGDESLKAVVTISGVSDYYALMAGQGFGVPFDFTGWGNADASANPRQTCTASDATLTEQANTAGNNPKAPFWAEQRAVPEKGKWTAPTLMVSGMRDHTVPGTQAAMLWEGLKAADVPRAWWLHQGGHDDAFDVDRGPWVEAVHQWFDHFLLGRDGVPISQGVRVQNADLSWRQLSDFPDPAASTQEWTIGATLAPSSGGKAAVTELGKATTQSEVLTIESHYEDLSQKQSTRVVSLSAPLTAPLTITGSPVVTVKVRADENLGELAVGLVVVGAAPRPVSVPDLDHYAIPTTGQDCWGEQRQATVDGKTITDGACYPKRGLTLKTTPAGLLSRVATVAIPAPGADQWSTVTLTLAPIAATIPAGSKLAVVIGPADPDTGAIGKPTTLTVGTSTLAITASS